MNESLIQNIQSKDDRVRGPAWQNAAPYGAAAILPLADVTTDSDFEVARSARRALYRIVRHAGRPGAAAEAKAVEQELIKLLCHDAALVRREALWMLSEIGGDDAVPPMAALLRDREAREDARCALTRLPGSAAIGALESAFESAPEEFKPALAESLRQRGQAVSGYPSQKLVPVQQTTVGPGMKQ